MDETAANHGMLLGYAGAGLVLTLLCARLARLERSADPEARRFSPGALGLGRSRGAVLQLAGLQALDALAGGFIMQSLLGDWFHVRFGAGPEALGALFFGTSLLSALSFLVATRVAEGVGLLNTMVFTYLPSKVLLLVVPFMPSFGTSAAVLLARHVLSQMDVPTRNALAVPAGRRAEDRLRPEPLLPVPLGAAQTPVGRQRFLCAATTATSRCSTSDSPSWSSAASDSETKTRVQRQTGTPDAPRSKAGLHVGP